MKMGIVIDIVGWVGSVLILAAYGLNSYQKIKSDSLGYYLLNLSGGICLIIYSIQKEAFANTFINVIWVLVAIPAIIGILKHGKV
jgi:hypothetical protein